jgi:hypothetical protein
MSIELFVSIFSVNYFLVAWFFLFKGGIMPLLGTAGESVSDYFSTYRYLEIGLLVAVLCAEMIDSASSCF